MTETALRTTVEQRRPELDAIRTFVVVGLVFFHASLVFDASDDYYVKNPDTTSVTTVLAGFGVLWAMPALFLIAGFGSWHSMARRGAGGFVRERLQRLGVPLLFAILTFLPVPVWLRLKAADPGYHESYLSFLPRFYEVHLDLGDFPFILRGDYFETGHLWFVVLLLTFSLLLAAVVRWLPGGQPLARAVDRRGVVLLPAFLTSAICAFIGMEEPFAGWSRWAYLLFFLCGYLVASDERFRLAMRRDAVPAAIAGAVVFAASGPVLLTAGDEPFTAMTPHAIAGRALFGFAGWCAVVAILGLLDRRNTGRTGRKEPGRPFRYLAEAALPLYVLHQPIVVAVAYGVVQWHAPIVVKYLAIVVASLALTLAAYEFLVRRTRVTRYLMGMRPTT
ncbi:acyltransferase family protein [Asanoa sp. NPDC049573]|uniref:acyltransferase family protein n=1 Tax=Asanoa sp. NPDC049573 TaxID=3155396 RepID=UPI003428B477